MHAVVLSSNARERRTCCRRLNCNGVKLGVYEQLAIAVLLELMDGTSGTLARIVWSLWAFTAARNSEALKPHTMLASLVYV